MLSFNLIHLWPVWMYYVEFHHSVKPGREGGGEHVHERVDLGRSSFTRGDIIRSGQRTYKSGSGRFSRR